MHGLTKDCFQILGFACIESLNTPLNYTFRGFFFFFTYNPKAQEVFYNVVPDLNLFILVI